jgi:hypothetical protein
MIFPSGATRAPRRRPVTPRFSYQCPFSKRTHRHRKARKQVEEVERAGPCETNQLDVQPLPTPRRRRQISRHLQFVSRKWPKVPKLYTKRCKMYAKRLPRVEATISAGLPRLRSTRLLAPLLPSSLTSHWWRSSRRRGNTMKVISCTAMCCARQTHHEKLDPSTLQRSRIRVPHDKLRYHHAKQQRVDQEPAPSSTQYTGSSPRDHLDAESDGR